ncbi:endonuclease III [Planctomycetota bacterium]
MVKKSPLAHKALKIVDILRQEFPKASCSLRFKEPWQLLISTMLSAQCTDVRVNKVTAILWQKYRSPADFAAAPLEMIEDDIRSTGFFRNKAKNIKGACRMLVEKYDGLLPETLDELTALPGVGRKTANVVLGTVFGKPAVVVDTHVKRICLRLGLTNKQDPEIIEFELMEILPRKSWSGWAHLLIAHGRKTCIARRPKCHVCRLADCCDYVKNQKQQV